LFQVPGEFTLPWNFHGTNLTEAVMKVESSSKKGNQLQVCVSLPPEYVERLKQLSRETHEPMAHFFREALRLLFQKHQAQQRKAPKGE
jgi:hypothetical protein